jgi:hypothetical protein
LHISLGSIPGAGLISRPHFRIGTYYLGPSGTAESRERCHRLIAEWEAAGRRLPEAIDATGRGEETTVTEIILAYWQWAGAHYDESDLRKIRAVLRTLRRLYGSTPAAAFGRVRPFGPRNLWIVRANLLREPGPRGPRSCLYINQLVA